MWKKQQILDFKPVKQKLAPQPPFTPHLTLLLLTNFHIIAALCALPLTLTFCHALPGSCSLC